MSQSVEQEIDKRVQKYVESYRGILPEDVIQKSAIRWTRELEEVASLAQEEMKQKIDEAILEISNYRPDLCDNSQEFKSHIIRKLSAINQIS